jgi:putative ABC transport system permease protein
MLSVPHDLRFAARALRRSPGFSIAVVLTLAIGIAAAVAVFAALEAALLRPLPYADPDALVLGRTTYPGGVNWTSSAQDWADIRDQTEGLSHLAAITGFSNGTTVTGPTEPLRAQRALASGDLFSTLGVDPALGRSFTAEESVLGGPEVAIVGNDFWREALESDPAIVGKTLDLDGRSTTIVGVMPAGFRFLFDVDLWLPLRMEGDYARARRFHNWVMVGRLADGATLPQVQEEVDAIAARLEEAYPDSNTSKGFRFDPLASVLTENSRPQLAALVAAVSLLILIAVANVAGLLLVRGAARRQELAVRAALGAPRTHLVRQLLAEGLLLSLAAGALGLLAAQLSASALLRLLPLDALGLERLSVNAPVVGFALLLSFLTAVAFSLLPALRASRVHPGKELSGSRAADHAGTARLRSALVIGQIAFTVVLLSGSGLLLRSLGALRSSDLGFRPDHLLTAELQLPRGEYPPELAERFYATLLERVRALPGVEDAGLINQLPIRDPGGNYEIQRADVAEGNEGIDGPMAYFRTVFPGYFRALGIPLIAGRDVGAEDTTDTPPVVIVNRRLAEVLFEGEDPVGQFLRVDASPDTPLMIVGVVGNVRVNGPASEFEPVFYMPGTQRVPGTARLALRLRGDARAIATELRGVLRELDSSVPLDGVETMTSILADRLGQRRVLTMALVLFAASALTLAAVGLYGVLADGVLQRRHEIGVRMALGAARERVVGLVLGRGSRLVGGGLLLGLLGSMAMTRAISGILYEVSPWDPLTLAAVAITLGVVGVIAVAVPAARAARVDPAISLRSE